MPVIHEEYLTTKFSSYGSKGSIILILLYAIFVIVMPYVIPLVTNKLWIDYSEMVERPRVTFTHKVITFLSPSSFTSGYKLWTSNKNTNSLIPNTNFIFPVFTSTHISLADRLVDLTKLHIRYGNYYPDDAESFQYQFQIPRQSSDSFSGIDILLEFGIILSNYKNLNITGLAHIKADLTRCSKLFINGALKLRQHYAFHGTDQILTYSDPIIDFSSVNSMDELSVSNFIQTLHDRDIAGIFIQESFFCKKGPDSSTDPLEININLKIPIQTYLYEVEWFEKAKFAWIQYVAFLPLIWYLGWWVKRIFILKGLVNSRIIPPNKKVI